MKTYTNTQAQAIREAKKLIDNNHYMTISSAQCDHGESFAVYVNKLKSLENVATFVECEHCKNLYKGYEDYKCEYGTITAEDQMKAARYGITLDELVVDLKDGFM